MTSKLLGLDIGGTKCAVVSGVSDGKGGIEILSRIFFPTETEKGVENTFRNLYDAIDKTLEDNKWKPEDVAAMGISCGGPLDTRKGIVMSPPNLPGWDNIPMVKMLEDRYGIRTRIQNDANACALAEWQFGAGRGFDNVVFLTFGTGMGSGLILDGRLYEGTNGNAGEVGHMRLEPDGPIGFRKAGSFEGFCSGGGLAQMGRKAAQQAFNEGRKVLFAPTPEDIPSISAKSIAQAAYAGDPVAREIFRNCGEHLGKALSVIVDIINPDVIVIGSIYLRHQDLLEEAMRKELEKEALDISLNVCKIVPAGLGEKIGDYAALSVGAWAASN